MVSGSLVTQVGILLVALTTLLTFAVGTGLLALAVRRSRRLVPRPPRRSRPVRRGLGGRSPVGRSGHRNRRAAGHDAPGDRRRLPGHRVEGGDPMILAGVSPLPGWVTNWHRRRGSVDCHLATAACALAFSGPAAARMPRQGGWVGPCAPRYGRPERKLLCRRSRRATASAPAPTVVSVSPARAGRAGRCPRR
jgi:hypothetical protein